MALAIRLPRLADRPMHTDEAVQAYLLGTILEGKGYQYRPRDLHGPAPLLAAWPIARAGGARDFSGLDERMLRLAPALIGGLATLLFGLLGPNLGTFRAALAAVLWSVAALPVYYSRYFIHETLFVTASLGFILCAWRMLARNSAGWSVAAGLFAGVMLGCKETGILSIAAMLFAALPALSWALCKKRASLLLLAFLAALALFLTLYSWGGAHPQGPLDFLESYRRFAVRAMGEGHEKPVTYYATLLCSSCAGKGIVLLALVGTVQAFLHGLRGPRFFALYGLLLFAISSAVPYKTPWLALNFWPSLAILAATGCTALWQTAQRLPARIALCACAAALLFLLGRETWARVYAQPCDERNPYAYAHTGEDLLRLCPRLEQWRRQTQKNAGQVRISVLAADPWPLPWYLRKFPLAGYWQPGEQPGEADLYITSPESWESLRARLQGWRPEYFGLRPEVLAILWAPCNDVPLPQTENAP